MVVFLVLFKVKVMLKTKCLVQISRCKSKSFENKSSKRELDVDFQTQVRVLFGAPAGQTWRTEYASVSKQNQRSLVNMNFRNNKHLEMAGFVTVYVPLTGTLNSSKDEVLILLTSALTQSLLWRNECV
ncbi:hypothetical protein STEG23_038276 [Scotinomys teguina]